jgi:hypothetical protein
MIDATRADFIDKDVAEVINDFLHHSSLKNITVEIRKSSWKQGHQVLKKTISGTG